MSTHLFTKNQELELQKTEAELTALKAQVNPHFLFNSLNSIYGMAMEKNDNTAATIQQLSDLMRYTLEKSNEKIVSIADEINFLQNYIELNRLRIPKQENILIECHINWDEKPCDIAPLLFTPIVENAFKYVVSIDYECFIKIELSVVNGNVYFKCNNKIQKKQLLEQGTGTGLDNLKKRLAFIYPENHHFQVLDLATEYFVEMKIG